MELKIFNNPNETFYAVKYGDEYTLESGEETFYDADDMDEASLEEWAKDVDLLEEDQGYIDKDGKIDYESLRENKRNREDEEYTALTPARSAFLYFHEEFEFPKHIKIKLIDGYSPGNDWQAVEVKDFESLVLLQSFLEEEEGIKVNFILQ